MKNKVISILVDKALGNEKKYSELLQLMNSKFNIMQVRNFQSGYTEHKLNVLLYEAQKAFEISDLDIHNFKPEENSNDEKNNEEQKSINPGAGEGSQNPDETQIPEQSNPFFKALETNTDAQEGLKFRDEYPFLKNPDCPSEIHALVGEKITAWEQFALNREALDLFTILPDQPEDITEFQKKLIEKFEAYTPEEKEDALYMYAKSAVENFQLNADIKAELDFYKEKGKVLGKHPSLNNLAIKQEISELDEAGLVEMKTKASKNASKARTEIENKGTNEAREKRVNDWELRQKLSEERLEKEFKKQ